MHWSKKVDDSDHKPMALLVTLPADLLLTICHTAGDLCRTRVDSNHDRLVHVAPTDADGRIGRLSIANKPFSLSISLPNEDLPLTNEDFGRMKCGFSSTFKGREYSIWDTNR